jgi:hypothetical protein
MSNPFIFYRIIDENLSLDGATVTVDELENLLSLNFRENESGELIVRWIPSRYGGGIYDGEPEFAYREWLESGANWRTIAIREISPNLLAEAFDEAAQALQVLPTQYVRRLREFADQILSNAVDFVALDRLAGDLTELADEAAAAARLLHKLREALDVAANDELVRG